MQSASRRMPLTAETGKRNPECDEVQQSQVSSSRPFLLSSLEPCVFEALKTCLLLLRVDGSVQFASRCVNDVFGISQEEIIGKHVRDVVLPEDYPCFEQCLSRLREVQRQCDSQATGAQSDVSTVQRGGTADASSNCTEQQLVTALQNSGDSVNQNQMLIVPQFAKQTFVCRMRRLQADSCSRELRNSPDTHSGKGARCGEHECFAADVTAFARWCSADEEVGGGENAARILADPHKQLCLLCVLRRCVSVSRTAHADSSRQSNAFCAALANDSANLCSSQPLTAAACSASVCTPVQPAAPSYGVTESSSLIELLTSDGSDALFDCDTQPLYPLVGAFDSCPSMLSDTYTSTSFFDSVLVAQNCNAAASPDGFYASLGGPVDPAFDPLISQHTQNNAMRFVVDLDAPRLKSPLGLSRTPTPTTPSGRHGLMAPSQLATVSTAGRATPQHGRPSGGSESRKLRELLLKGPGTPADPADPQPLRVARSCSVETPPDAACQASRRSSVALNTPSDRVSPSPAKAPTPSPASSFGGIAPSKLESVGPSGWIKDSKASRIAQNSQSILIQLLNTDEPNTRKEDTTAAISVSCASSTATVSSTTTSVSRVRAKRGSVKECVTAAPILSPPASRTTAKRAASMPLEDSLQQLASFEPLTARPPISLKLTTVAKNIAHTTAYPLRSSQPSLPPPEAPRTPGAPSELEKLLRESSHGEDPARRPSGEPSTTTGSLNALASSSTAAQNKRAPRRSRKCSGQLQPSPSEAPAPKRRLTPAPIDPSVTSPAGFSRAPPSVSATSSAADLNEVANLLYDFSDSSEQMQCTRTFSDISAPLSVRSKRMSATSQATPSIKTAKDERPESDSKGSKYTPLTTDTNCGALMSLLTSNSPQDQSVTTAPPVPWLPLLPPPDIASNTECTGNTTGNFGARPISSQTNAALCNFVRSKQRSSIQQSAVTDGPDSNLPQLLISNSANAPDGSESFQTQHGNTMPFGRLEPLPEVAVNNLFEPPFGPVAGTFALDVNGQPVPVSVGPFGTSLARPPPPSYQMTTGGMKLAPPHVSDNIVSSTTSGCDAAVVSSTISPSQPSGALRLQTAQQSSGPLALLRNAPAQDPLLSSNIAQLSPFQVPSALPRTCVLAHSEALQRQFSPDTVGIAPTDDISQYLESLSSSELDSLINSVSVNLPPSGSPFAPSPGPAPMPYQLSQFVTVNAPQSQQATFAMPPPNIPTQVQRGNSVSQFFAPHSQPSPVVLTAPPMLARGAEPPNVLLPADQSALLRAAIDQSGMPPSAFGLQTQQPALLSPRTPLISPVRRTASHSSLAPPPMLNEPQPQAEVLQNSLPLPLGNPPLEVLSGSKLAELMRAAVPPNVALPSNSHMQIPLQTATSTPQFTNARTCQPQTVATQQKAGFVASQIVREAELKQQQAASQAILLKQLQARSKLQRSESDLGSALASPPDRSAASGPNLPQNALARAQISGSVLASLINSPPHSPPVLLPPLPPSAFACCTMTHSMAFSDSHASLPPMSPRVAQTVARRSGSQTLTQTLPVFSNRFASSLCATSNEQSPIANTNASQPSASTSVAPNGSSQSELTDDIIDTVEQLVQTHRSKLSRRSGSRTSVSDQPAEAAPRTAKRHDSLLERLLAENN